MSPHPELAYHMLEQIDKQFQAIIMFRQFSFDHYVMIQ